jgi:hypothetical protein
MGGHEARTYWEDRGLLLLWIGVLSGPAAWASNQLIGYALVKPVCAGGRGPMLMLISAAALAVIIAGGAISWSCLARLRHANPEGGRQQDRSYFLAVAGLALNVLLGVLVLTAATSPFFLSPCE